jgi:hypothetical protein
MSLGGIVMINRQGKQGRKGRVCPYQRPLGIFLSCAFSGDRSHAHARALYVDMGDFCPTCPVLPSRANEGVD